METKSSIDNNIEILIEKKNTLRNSFKENPEEVLDFYNSLKTLDLISLKKIFPSPGAVIEQEIFDTTSEIISADSIEECAKVSAALFRRKNTEKSNSELFEKDLLLLQALFFYLLRDISNEDDIELFNLALQKGSWYTAKKQVDLLNTIFSKLNFSTTNPFTDIDFRKLNGKHFEQNESILRLFYNFMHPLLYSKEGIVNELNFVREQQKSILPVFPNLQKTNYKNAEATREIRQKEENLKLLNQLDFGFYDSSYSQSFFSFDEQYKKSFSRPLICRCFKESLLEWDVNPFFDDRYWIRKIVARKSDRAENKSALENKFLYSERNIITHTSENFAVYKLFVKEYKKKEIKYWEGLVLESMYDTYQYILKIKEINVQQKLKTILNHYFEKITQKLDLHFVPVEQRWNELFDNNGELNLDDDDLIKTNIYNILNDDEITHFKRFMGFMYCSENDESDFFERNRCHIQLYLIYMSLSLSMMDK
ncbi:MAG: hypothetical protein K6G09_09005 [Treponema sp.]|nr:hypothetical protein [Treponema sp.]